MVSQTVKVAISIIDTRIDTSYRPGEQKYFGEIEQRRTVTSYDGIAKGI